jgi:hypothetical protein
VSTVKYILFLLFIYLLFIRPAIKRAKSGGGAQPAARQPPLNALFEKIKEQLRQAKETAEQRSPEGKGAQGASTLADLFSKLQEPAPARDPFPLQDEAAKSFDDEEAGWRPAGPEDVLWDQPPEPVQASPPPLPQQPAASDVVAKDDEVLPRAMPREGPGYRGMNLRTAVVWSEILGPPVGLRDRDEES